MLISGAAPTLDGRPRKKISGKKLCVGNPTVGWAFGDSPTVTYGGWDVQRRRISAERRQVPRTGGRVVGRNPAAGTDRHGACLAPARRAGGEEQPPRSGLRDAAGIQRRIAGIARPVS